MTVLTLFSQASNPGGDVEMYDSILLNRNGC